MKKEVTNSRLIPVLREGIAIIQMILFKEIKSIVAIRYPDLGSSDKIMLAGAITNEVFGSQNNEQKFLNFRNNNRGRIEQELLILSKEIPDLVPSLADALRMQILCDHQEDIDSSHILKQAEIFKLLPPDRDIPLPSAFMETVRALGALHNLIIPPAEIDSEEENTIIQ